MSDELTDWSLLREQPSKFVSTILGLDPFDYQEDFLDTDARHRVVASGRQVGKSRMCSWIALWYALTHANSQVLITAPSQRQASLLFDTLTSEISNSGMSDEEWGIGRQTQTILEFANDSAIHCLPTGRNGDNIRGYTSDMVIVDEAAFVDDAIFEDVLEPMLLATSGHWVLASTPYGRTGFFYRKFDRAEHDDEWHATQVHSRENPLISDEDIESMKEGKTEAQIDREIRGVFTEDAAQFFPEEGITKAYGLATSQATGKTYLGADIAATGSDRTMFYGIDESGNVFLQEDYEDMGVLGAADRIATLDRSYNFEQIAVDRTGLGQGTAEALAEDTRLERKLETKYFNLQTKQQLYQTLKKALEDEALWLPDEPRLKTQLNDITSEKTKTGNLRFDTRECDHDDHVDALALAVSCVPELTGSRQRGSTRPVTGTPRSGRSTPTGTDSSRSTRSPKRRGGGRSWDGRARR